MASRKNATKVFLCLAGLIVAATIGGLIYTRLAIYPTLGIFDLIGPLLAFLILLLAGLLLAASFVGYVVFLKSLSFKKTVLAALCTFFLPVAAGFGLLSLSAATSRKLDLQKTAREETAREAAAVTEVRESNDEDSITTQLDLEVKKDGRYLLEVVWESDNYPIKITLAPALLDNSAIDLGKQQALKPGRHSLTLKWQLKLDNTITNEVRPISIMVFYSLEGVRSPLFKNKAVNAWHYQTKKYTSGFYFTK